MSGYVATFTPHGANPDQLQPATWRFEAANDAAAAWHALDLVGDAIGDGDFAYRDLADGSMTILDTLCGTAKIATLRVVRRSLQGHR